VGDPRPELISVRYLCRRPYRFGVQTLSPNP